MEASLHRSKWLARNQSSSCNEQARCLWMQREVDFLPSLFVKHRCCGEHWLSSKQIVVDLNSDRNVPLRRLWPHTRPHFAHEDRIFLLRQASCWMLLKRPVSKNSKHRVREEPRRPSWHKSRRVTPRTERCQIQHQEGHR